MKLLLVIGLIAIVHSKTPPEVPQAKTIKHAPTIYTNQLHAPVVYTHQPNAPVVYQSNPLKFPLIYTHQPHFPIIYNRPPHARVVYTHALDPAPVQAPVAPYAAGNVCKNQGGQIVPCAHGVAPGSPFYFRKPIGTCTAEEQAKITEINKHRVGPSVLCDQALMYIAWAHSKDQNDFYNSKSEGTTLYTPSCNKHSWKLNKPCCYGPNHANPECMWDALKRVTGNDYGIGHIYEISYGPDVVNKLYSDSTLEEAITSFLSSGGHEQVLRGTNGWAKNTRFGGCSVVGKYVNCVFSA
eukprot:01974.XXX_16357_15352_1 [CDS] Oithona nana genome sequencing.